MPTSAANAITELPVMSWRGIPAPPYDVAGYSGRHDQAPRNWPYIDGAGHDHTGRSQFQCTFKLYFINTLVFDAFPDLYNDWVNAVVFDGSPDKLKHPLLGELDAVPVDFSVELVAGVTAGVIMNVTFEETVLDPNVQLEPKSVQANLKAMAAAADSAGAELPDYPDGVRTDDLLDTLDQIESSIYSLRTSVDGLVNQGLGIINGALDNLEQLQDHAQWATHDLFVNLYNGIKDLGERIGARTQRQTSLYLVSSNTTLDTVATEVDNTVGELMTLNPTLLGKPDVDEGVEVVYFSE